MNALITSGVKVSVQTRYQSKYSNPGNHHYMFAYRITIENLSDYTVQLISRHWDIFDANGESRDVDGNGVVGKQPALNPGQSYSYVSGCNLKSGIGKMKGRYQMKRLVDGESFTVEIPEFGLQAPVRLN